MHLRLTFIAFHRLLILRFPINYTKGQTIRNNRRETCLKKFCEWLYVKKKFLQRKRHA